jgi:hypothetical protein
LRGNTSACRAHCSLFSDVTSMFACLLAYVYLQRSSQLPRAVVRGAWWKMWDTAGLLLAVLANCPSLRAAHTIADCLASEQSRSTSGTAPFGMQTALTYRTSMLRCFSLRKSLLRQATCLVVDLFVSPTASPSRNGTNPNGFGMQFCPEKGHSA